MFTAGVDVGARNVKVAILREGKVAGRALQLTGIEPAKAVEEALARALEAAKAKRPDLKAIGATGAGRKGVAFKTLDVPEAGAAARGSLFLVPGARTVIEVGAEEGRGIRCDEKGKVVESVANGRCAAGAGSFIESMARALEVPLSEMGALSLRSTRTVPLDSQCAVFAESEVVSLIHAQTPREDIARAVHDAIAGRVVSMVRKIGLAPRIVLVGGVAGNPGFVDSIRRSAGAEVAVPEDPIYAGAIGAALAALPG
jgi:benzoyl-CoA reductase subunit D